MKRKGQSAIEYLTTYGWMLLVVAIVGGSIFTTVQNSADIQSVSGLSNAEVRVSDYGLSEDGLQFSLRSAAAEQVNIRKITVTNSETGVSADISPSKVVSVGDTASFELKDVQKTEAIDTYNLEFTYDVGGLTGKVAEGEITGSFDVFNRISLENAEFNRSTDKLQIKVENTGDNTTDSINYTVEANNTEYNGSLSNLDSRETGQINVSTDETYPLESVKLDTEGYKFIDSSSDLQCTPTKSLVGYWTFNEETIESNYVQDVSEYENNASYNSDVVFEEGKVGEAAQFEDKNGEISAPFAPSLNITGNITIDLWLKHDVPYDQTGGNDYRIAVGRSNGYQPYGFLVEENGKLVGNAAIDGSRQYIGQSNKKMEVKNWNKASYTYENNTGVGRVFVDGELDFKDSYDSGSWDTSNSPVELSGRDDNHWWNGKLDEVRIYNRSLPQSEIQRLYEVRSEDWAVSGCRLTG